MRDEPSQILRLSTRDVAPADRLSYASWILGSALAPSAVSAGTPAEYELDVTALMRRAKKTGDRVALSTHPQRARLAIFCRAFEDDAKAIEARNGAARKEAVS